MTGLLVLSRKLGQTVVIEGDIRCIILGIRAGQVKLGFEAPRDVSIDRLEIFQRKVEEDFDEALAEDAERGRRAAG